MNTERNNLHSYPRRSTLASLLSKAFTDQSGQTLPFVALLMLSMLGVSGVVIDVGQAYVVRSQLQLAANSSALAAAGYVYTAQSSSVNTTTEADQYSASTGGKNTISGGTTVKTAVSTMCLNMLLPKGSSCSSSSSPNAVQVVLSTPVKTMFMALFGVKTLNVSATATASMQGVSQPWNVAIILDATGSMATVDTNCGGVTEFQCALNGAQTLLVSTNPCPLGASSCTASNANVHMALFSFPNMITSDLPLANACTGQTFTTPLPYQVMTLPKANATSYTPLSYKENGKTWSASYEVTYAASDADTNGFVSDYYQPSNTTTGGLNPSSSIVQAVGYGGSSSSTKTGCLPTAPGGIALNGATGTTWTSSTTVNTANVGEGITYYPGAIYAAQSALIAEQKLYPGSKNAIILLGDGANNAQWIYFPAGSLSQTPSANTSTPSTIATGSSGYSTTTSTPNTSQKVASGLSSPSLEASGTISGVYPDFLDECQQSIVAGQAATAAGTTVYTVAYGSAGSGQAGCTTGGKADDYNDVTLVATGKNVSFTLSTLSPCVEMENIASSLTTFYSDYNQSGSNSDCYDNSHSVTNLQDIFSAISATFTTPRLLPNNAS